MQYNFDRRKGEVFTTFFEGAQTNICYNALDRHIEQGRGSQPCFLWEVCSSVQCIMPTRNFNRCRSAHEDNSWAALAARLAICHALDSAAIFLFSEFILEHAQ